MKKQKGFTLIELLAVIVILAIIALIATPMIMGVIDKAKKGAAEASAYGYIQAVENNSVFSMFEVEGYTAIGSGVIDIKNLPKIEVDGEKPTEGWVAIENSGNVVAAFLKFNSYNGYVGYTEELHARATLKENSVSSVTPGDAGTTVEDALEAMETALGKKASE